MPIAKKMYICDSVNLAETASMSKKAPNFVWAKISGEVALHQIPNFMVFLGKCDHSETTSLRDVWLQSVFVAKCILHRPCHKLCVCGTAPGVLLSGSVILLLI